MEYGTANRAAGPGSYLTLIRYRNCIMSGIAAFLGAFVVTGTAVAAHLFPILTAMVVVFLFTAAGNTLNDYLDAEIDKSGHPDRPIPSGSISRKSAKTLSGVLFVLSVILSALIGLYSLAIVLISLVLMISYEFRLKRAGLSGNLTIAWLTASLFLYGAVAVGSAVPIWALFTTSFLATAGREIIKDVQDMDSDRGVRRTLPMAIGASGSMALSSVFLLGAVAVSPFPYLLHQFGYLFLGVVAAADVIFIYATFIQRKSASRAQSVAKTAMYIALLAFLVGALEI